jgi:hypothetical protein
MTRRSQRSFPFWVSPETWAFVVLAGVLCLGVVGLDRLGFDPDPIAALAVSSLPLTAAALFLHQDWRWHREDTRR